jgi:hypothetical protein
MPVDFTSLHNYYEKQVVDLVVDMAHKYPGLSEDQDSRGCSAGRGFRGARARSAR